MLDRRTTLGLIGRGLIAATASGCAEELGPEVFATTKVEGTIRIGGRPVSAGWVEFQPVDGTRGNLRSAPIRPDGSFSADRVPVGQVAVGLAGVRGPAIPTGLGPVELRAFRAPQTPIRVVIPPGASSRLDVDLADQADAFLRRSQAMKRRREAPEGRTPGR